MSPTDVHHRRTMRGILLILVAVFTFSAMDALAEHLLKSYPMSARACSR
jgi:hypothetical protein